MNKASFDISPAIDAAIRADERRKCWEEINAMIRHGPLPGAGWDKTAERNGLILAANRLFDASV